MCVSGQQCGTAVGTVITQQRGPGLDSWLGHGRFVWSWYVLCGFSPQEGLGLGTARWTALVSSNSVMVCSGVRYLFHTTSAVLPLFAVTFYIQST